jgi:hypothetical protein
MTCKIAPNPYLLILANNFWINQGLMDAIGSIKFLFNQLCNKVRDPTSKSQGQGI